MLSSRFLSSGHESADGSATCTCWSIGCSVMNLSQRRWPMYGVSSVTALAASWRPASATTSTATDFTLS